MRLPALLFAIACAIALVLSAAVWSGSEAPPQARPHPAYPSLLQGGDGAERSAPIAVHAALFGALQIAFFGACFALGMRRGSSLGPVARPLVLGLLVYEGVFALLLYGYARYLADPGAPLVFSFPLPTAVLLYAFWPLPLWFAWIYLRHFDGWVVDEREIERVLTLAATHGASPGADPERDVGTDR
jgi:hypothetical protein